MFAYCSLVVEIRPTRRCTVLWIAVNSISRHFEAMGNPPRAIRGFLRWCRISFIDSMRQATSKIVSGECFLPGFLVFLQHKC